MLFNEEGAIKDFPVNEKASKFIFDLYPEGYPVVIFGNAMLLPKSLRQRKW